MSDSLPLLSVEDLYVEFNTYAGVVRAVNGMNFEIYPGEIFGLVGESGCGKSVTGLAIVRVLPGKGRITRGSIRFHNQDLAQMDEKSLQKIRGRKIAMIFQDPSASLNPVFTIGDQITRLVQYHNSVSAEQAHQIVLERLADVALPDPERICRSYSFQLSGGMQQRVMIAMALASGAELLIADEPTTALDVTIQKQILELLVAMRARLDISILLITHNLGVVAETCDRVGVAYAGRIVETGKTRQVLYSMKHPYTQGLLAALPVPERRGSSLPSIPGGVPSGTARIQGCPFHPRCPQVMEVCSQEKPGMRSVGEADHSAACFLYPGEDV